MAPQITPIWENLFYGIIDRVSLKAGYRKISAFNIGDKVIAGQVVNAKNMPNGNTQKRIVTVYPNGRLGLETKVYSPDGELLKVYAGIRTTHGTKCYNSGKDILKEDLLKMHKSENIQHPKIFDEI